MKDNFFIFDPVTLEIKSIDSVVLRNLTNFTIKKINLYKTKGIMLPKINCFVVDKDTPSRIIKDRYSSVKYDDEVFVKVPDKNYDFYEVSNYGRVRNINRLNGKHLGLMLPVRQNAKTKRHSTVFLTGADRKRKEYTVHKLVMISFYGRPDYDYYIYHKDGNHFNNVIGNLEYRKRDSVAFSSWARLKITPKQRGCKSIMKCDLEGKVIERYSSINDAAKKNFISRDVISYAAKYKKEKFGYMWRFSKN